MTRHAHLSGFEVNVTLQDQMQGVLRNCKPKAVAIASAFVSVNGFRTMRDLLRNVEKCRLIAGIDHAITHPQALFDAFNSGWEVRLATGRTGIFHPKFILLGEKFDRKGLMNGMCGTYVGSSNLTKGGLTRNVECGIIDQGNDCLADIAVCFQSLWSVSEPAREQNLKNYAAIFADRSRSRRVKELNDLGINDFDATDGSIEDLSEIEVPVAFAVGPAFSVCAWVGLQSFTGEFRFQVEFPKNAGLVVRQMLQDHQANDGRVDVLCIDSTSVVTMQYKFYEKNGMFRLNIPNDAPGVQWARANKDGIAVIKVGLKGGAPLQLQILPPGEASNEIISRSLAMGTWGRTPTRIYGWF
jgi:HKD family nuclease